MSAVMDRWAAFTPAERQRRRLHPECLSDHEARLEEGWVWLKKHPNHRDVQGRFERWECWLHEYEAAYREATQPRQEALL